MEIKVGDSVKVNNVKSASLTNFIPRIKNEILKIKRIIHSNLDLNSYTVYVVDYNKTEVYLYRWEFKIQRKTHVSQ